MPVYATPSPAFSDRRLRPTALLLIVAGHAAAIAAVMSARMDLFVPPRDPPLVVNPIPIPADPPPRPVNTQQTAPSDSVVDRPPAPIPLPLLPGPPLDSSPLPLPDAGPIVGPAIDPMPRLDPPARSAPVRTGPRFATPPHALKPPYPPSKQRLDEEATLRLRLSIDERGRVVAVEPVGSADPIFLDAARRHILARWRYKPATEDGRPVVSSTVITLQFQLE